MHVQSIMDLSHLRQQLEVLPPRLLNSLHLEGGLRLLRHSLLRREVALRLDDLWGSLITNYRQLRSTSRK